jgi:hypothetical protein
MQIPPCAQTTPTQKLGAHRRSVVAVGDSIWISVALQVVRVVHFRLEVVVGAEDSYSVSGMQTASGEHVRSDVTDDGTDSYSPNGLQTVRAVHTRLLVSVAITEMNWLPLQNV